MRYQPAHAAKSGSVPFMLRGPKSVRTTLTAAVAGIVGLVPTVLVSSPAYAAAEDGVYSIADTEVTEGGLMTFTITRTKPANGNTIPQETVRFTTSNGVATAPGDYTAVTPNETTGVGTVVFPATSNTASNMTRTVTVQTTQDQDDEADDEDFTVTLTASTASPNITFGTAAAVGTIRDDDNPTFTLSSNPTTVSEGLANADRHATVTATLSKDSPFDVTIPIATEDGTAKAPQDYDAVDDAIVIPAGDPSGFIEVEVKNDTIDEPQVQSFTVKTATGLNVTGTQSVTVNIEDNDAAPTVDLDPATAVSEGGTLTFNATLSGQSENTVTAKWATADGAAGTQVAGHGNAKAGDDYEAATGTLTFDPLSQTPKVPITVKTKLDSIDEAIEDLQVKITEPTNASVSNPSAQTGSINDSGTTPGPQVTLTPVEVTEGGPTISRARTFKVTLSKASGRQQKVQYIVGAGSADAGAGIGVPTNGVDFTAVSATTLTFEPGETEKSFTVDVMGDNVDEGNGENMVITLSDASSSPGLAAGLNLTANQVLIKDDDDKPVLSLVKSDFTENETNGPVAVLYQLKLSNPSAEDVDWVAAASSPAGTATNNVDYEVVTPLTGTIQAGQTSGYMLVVINGDEVFEPDETVRYTITRDSDDDATGGPLNTSLTITNDDMAPSLEVLSIDAAEGETPVLRGVVTGSSSTQTVLNISLTGKAMGGKAAASGTDFSPAAFPVTISANTPSGSTVNIGTLTIADDTTPEPAETILVSGTGFAGTGKVVDGVVTIPANDGEAPSEPDAELTLMSSAAFRLGVGSLKLSGKATAGASVTLWGKPIGAAESADWQNLGNTTASSAGTYDFFPKFTTTGWWFRTNDGTNQSNAVKVNLKQDPDFFARSSARGQAVLSVFGDPRVAGLSVRILRANSNGTWSTVGQGTLDANGKFVRTLTGLRSGASYLYKATVYGDGDVGMLTNTSKSIRLSIR
ncbi:Calx-beta domain-containing protein [Actinoplanes sp. NPDC051859]|uniref:Calx-beta domain-containing protein n=1 Tax=Actinoplanes sp. NPDC051859 TaxID=3363909 RepID=UPI0037B62EF3